MEILISFARGVQSPACLRGSLKDSRIGLMPDECWLLDALDAKRSEEAEEENGW